MSAVQANPRGGSRLFWYALSISAAVHLSAVTIFNVVIYFPVSEVEYFDFRFVEAPRGTLGVEEGQPLAVSPNSRWQFLPKLQSPTVEESTEGRLALSNPFLQQRSLVDEIYGNDDAPPSVFGAAVENIQTAIQQLGAARDQFDLANPPRRERTEMTLSDGVRVTMEWPAGVTPRALLFSPSLQGSLWQLDSSVVEGGITYVLTLDESGVVVRAWNEDVSLSGELASVEAKLMQYRFEPRPTGQSGSQDVTLHLRAPEEQP